MTRIFAEAWTLAYFPFTMGGNVWRPMRTKVEVTGPYDLGKGFEGYLCLGPNGATKVIEKECGAVVGDSLEEVKSDIAACDDVELMRSQCRDATSKLRDVVDVDHDEWWNRILGGSK